MKPGDGDWKERLKIVVDMMRELSVQTDPQEMVRAYGARVRQLIPSDRMVSISRRELTAPWFRITRSSLWKDEVNPWKQPDLLPVFDRGLLSEFIYGDEPRIIDEIQCPPDDPAAEYFAGMKSLVAIPILDGGESLNMVVLMRKEKAAFDREQLPELVWMTNLFGRATQNLVLKNQVQDAFDEIDFELKQVEDIQRSLLPPALPQIENMDIEAFYQPSHRAGGAYYDSLALPQAKWGMIIADVSGHGTPAAVMMAITHSIAHTLPGAPTPPSRMLAYLNGQLSHRYTTNNGSFVTAFYGIFNPVTRELTYASAGHNAPRLKRCEDGTMTSLDGIGGLPLGILPEETYKEATHNLRPGDQIVFYTDGITEAHNPRGEMFGLERLDKVLEDCRIGATPLIEAVLVELNEFTSGHPADDDRTLLVAKIR